MGDLKTWMEQQLEERLVEPNSRLGGAFDYLLKRWKALTRFLHIPGAPLDNNTAERALKIILRYRKNSLFYKNEHGAYVGDVLTSLIETCRLNGDQSAGLPPRPDGEPLGGVRRPRGLAALELPRCPAIGGATAAPKPPAASHRPSRRPRGCRSTVGSAARAPRADGWLAAVDGHQVKRPWDRRFWHSQNPWPS